MMNRKKMKQEALVRMDGLKLHSKIKKIFESDDTVLLSYGGSVFYLPESYLSFIHDWEKETNSLVYHTIMDISQIGQCLSLLYISEYDEEWEYDKQDIKINEPIVYVKNLTYDECSEYGSISIQNVNGSLVRTA